MTEVLGGGRRTHAPGGDVGRSQTQSRSIPAQHIGSRLGSRKPGRSMVLSMLAESFCGPDVRVLEAAMGQDPDVYLRDADADHDDDGHHKNARKKMAERAFREDVAGVIVRVGPVEAVEGEAVTASVPFVELAFGERPPKLLVAAFAPVGMTRFSERVREVWDRDERLVRPVRTYAGVAVGVGEARDSLTFCRVPRSIGAHPKRAEPLRKWRHIPSRLFVVFIGFVFQSPKGCERRKCGAGGPNYSNTRREFSARMHNINGATEPTFYTAAVCSSG